MSRNWVNLTWRQKTWGERAQTVLCNIVATVFGRACVAGVLLAVGRSVDGIDRYNTEHDRCLKRATNGYMPIRLTPTHTHASILSSKQGERR